MSSATQNKVLLLGLIHALDAEKVISIGVVKKRLIEISAKWPGQFDEPAKLMARQLDRMEKEPFRWFDESH